jgi:hypothetical protein
MIFDNAEQQKILLAAINALGSNAFSSDAQPQFLAAIVRTKHEVLMAEIQPPQVSTETPPENKGSGNANEV